MLIATNENKNIFKENFKIETCQRMSLNEYVQMNINHNIQISFHLNNLPFCKRLILMNANVNFIFYFQKNVIKWKRQSVQMIIFSPGNFI